MADALKTRCVKIELRKRYEHDSFGPDPGQLAWVALHFEKSVKQLPASIPGPYRGRLMFSAFLKVLLKIIDVDQKVAI